MGVRVTVRLLSLPPKTMLLVGTSAGRDELAETVRFDAAVSGSPTTNGSGGVAVSWVVAWLAMAEMTGGWLMWLTVTVKERETRLLLAPPSLTVTAMVEEPKA